MLNLIQHLKQNKLNLDQSGFCKILKDESISDAEKMKFTPSMMAFVMGFPDMLRTLKKADQHQGYQAVVNNHCDEDSMHWLWYLKDIKTLASKNYIEADKTVIEPTTFWSEDFWFIRDNVYEVIHQCKSIESPFLRLVVIQVLEATFSSFNECVHPIVQRLGIASELDYFGVTHMEAEEGHTFDDWLHTDPTTVASAISAPEDEVEEGIVIISALYVSFQKMFDVWYTYLNEELNKQLVGA